MGSRQSKPDPRIEIAKKEQEAKKKANEEELKQLEESQRQQEQRMDAELEKRKNDLDALRKNMVESIRKNDEEFRELRKSQAQKARELEEERAEELCELKNSSEAEKQRVNRLFEERAAQLEREHEEVITRTLVEKEEEKMKAAAAIRKAEAERDEVERQKLEDVRTHRKALDEMSKEHRRKINEFYEQLNEEIEKQTLAAIERIALETNERMAIVDAAQLKVQDDAIKTIYKNYGKEYLAISTRFTKVSDHVRAIASTIDDVRQDPDCEFPNELGDLHSEFNTDSTVLYEQIARFRNRLKLSLDVSTEFKEQLLAPLAPYEESMKSVKSTELRIQKAVHNSNKKPLPLMYDTFEKHQTVLEDISKNMNAIKYEDVVNQILTTTAQKSVQN